MAIGGPYRRLTTSIHLESSRVNLTSTSEGSQGPLPRVCSSVSFRCGTLPSCDFGPIESSGRKRYLKSTLTRGSCEIKVRTGPPEFWQTTGIDLRLQADFLRMLQSSDRSFKRAFHTAKPVVALRIRTIQTNGHAGNPTCPELIDGLVCQQKWRPRSNGGPQPQADALLQQREQIWTLRGIATSEDHQLVAEGANFLE
jgi:hypothetical protein